MESILQVDPKIETLETSAQFVQIAPPSDIVITVLMEARFGDRRDAMSLCVPHMVIKPITPRLSSQNWVSSAGKRTTPMLRRMLTSTSTAPQSPATRGWARRACASASCSSSKSAIP